MHSLPLFVSPVLSARFAAVAGLLIASVWQGLLLTAVVAFSLRLLPGLSAAARSALWTAVLLLVLFMPFLPMTVTSSTRSGEGLWHAEEAVSFGIVLLWAAASITRLLRLAGDLVRLRGIVRRATPVAAAGEVAGVLWHHPRRVLLCASAEVDRPSVAGFFRPRILLPPDLLAGLSEGEMMQIVLHEAEHLRRYDDWINLLQQASLAVFPLNPALFWLNRRLSLERELACDDGVLRSTGARKAYAACLARVAEHSLVRRGVALALGVLGDWFGQPTFGRALFRKTRRKPELSRRVERILNAPAPTMGRLSMRFATGGVLAGLLGGASLLAHSPALVSFTPDSPSFAAVAAPSPLGRLPFGVASDQMTMKPVVQFQNAGPMVMQTVMRLPSAHSTVRSKATDSRPQPAHVRVRAFRKTRSPQARQIVMPQPRRTAQPAPWRLTSLDATQAPLRNVRPAVQTQGGVISAVAAEPAEQVEAAPRLVPVVFHRAGAWYTALPVQGGWLIVQL